MTRKFPDEFQLQRVGYFKAEDDPSAVTYCADRNALFDQAVSGKLYVKFIGGDRKGSIARVQIDPDYNHRPAEISEMRRYSSSEQRLFEITNTWIYGIAKWDKRKNSCQVSLPNDEVIFLPNYEGPTVYEMFDKKAAKEKLLKNPDQRDIDGRPLAVGDEVLYINARYGSGFVLNHGTIKEFKVTADSKGHSFVTIVKNDDADEESSISYPSQMIWKK
jgi:hypothetical protein